MTLPGRRSLVETILVTNSRHFHGGYDENEKLFDLATATRRTLCGPALLVPLFGFSLAGLAQDGPNKLFYTTSGYGSEIIAIHVTDGKITTTDIGPTSGGNCFSLALSPWGTMYSICGPIFGAQQLATIDLKTGHATLFGVPFTGLASVAMTFAPNGVLYAVGDCNPDPNFECRAGSDPNFNSLYTVNVSTGVFTRVGTTGAPQLFMDLKFDRNGNLFGETSTVFPTSIPAILYRINTATGVSTKVANLVGSNSVMGMAFDQDGKLYGVDFVQNPGLYTIDIKTGFETAIASVPFGFLSALEAAPLPRQ
jgi:hypothetical protein